MIAATHDELIKMVAEAAGRYVDGYGRPVRAKVWQPNPGGFARVYVDGRKDFGYIQVDPDGTVDTLPLCRERKNLSNFVAAAFGFDFGEGYTIQLPIG